METILEYDKIAVLGDGGKLAEYGTPSNLLSNKKGYLSQMVEQDENLRRRKRNVGVSNSISSTLMQTSIDDSENAGKRILLSLFLKFKRFYDNYNIDSLFNSFDSF